MATAMVASANIPKTMVIKAELTLSDGRKIIADQMLAYSEKISHCCEDVSTIEFKITAYYTEEMDAVFSGGEGGK